MRALRWVEVHGRLNVSSLGFNPVEGGRDSDGTSLYVAQAPYKDGVHPGKVSEKFDGEYSPFHSVSVKDSYELQELTFHTEAVKRPSR